MFVIPLGGMSELVLLGLVERAEAVLHAQAEGLSETESSAGIQNTVIYLVL
jgi:hypothetical protein